MASVRKPPFGPFICKVYSFKPFVFHRGKKVNVSRVDDNRIFILVFFFFYFKRAKSGLSRLQEKIITKLQSTVSALTVDECMFAQSNAAVQR